MMHTVEVLTFGSHAGWWLNGQFIDGGNDEQGVDTEALETRAAIVADVLEDTAPGGASFSVKEIEPPDDWQWDELDQFLDSAQDSTLEGTESVS